MTDILTDAWMDRMKVEEKEKWREWYFKIPYLRFKPEWEVSIGPPFTGAMARFRLRYKENEISVYLDCFSRLGFYGDGYAEPYWKMRPYENDTARFAMSDTEGLLAAIDKQFNSDWTEFYKEREERPARRKALIEEIKNDPDMGPIIKDVFKNN